MLSIFLTLFGKSGRQLILQWCRSWQIYAVQISNRRKKETNLAEQEWLAAFLYLESIERPDFLFPEVGFLNSLTRLLAVTWTSYFARKQCDTQSHSLRTYIFNNMLTHFPISKSLPSVPSLPWPWAGSELPMNFIVFLRRQAVSFLSCQSRRWQLFFFSISVAFYSFIIRSEEKLRVVT